jgi:hypothetical protein
VEDEEGRKGDEAEADEVVPLPWLAEVQDRKTPKRRKE